MTDLLILADRVEGLSGPCRETDFLIADAVGFRGSIHKRVHEPRYTASLDAAMTLVPEGCAFMLDWGHYSADPAGVIFHEAFVQQINDAAQLGNGESSTPALALTAACLRTIAANQENPDA